MIERIPYECPKCGDPIGFSPDRASVRYEHSTEGEWLSCECATCEFEQRTLTLDQRKGKTSPSAGPGR